MAAQRNAPTWRGSAHWRAWIDYILPGNDVLDLRKLQRVTLYALQYKIIRLFEEMDGAEEAYGRNIRAGFQPHQLPPRLPDDIDKWSRLQRYLGEYCMCRFSKAP
jgi:hypothetical protein